MKRIHTDRPRSRQFTLLGLLVAVLVVCLSIAWIKELTARRQATVQQQAMVPESHFREVRENFWRLMQQVQTEPDLLPEVADVGQERGQTGTFSAQDLDDPGYLEVVDPNTAYVRRVPNDEPLTWEYRVYHPTLSGGRWRIGAVCGNGRIGGRLHADDFEVGGLWPHVVAPVVISVKEADGQWLFRMQTPNLDITSKLAPHHAKRIQELAEAQQPLPSTYKQQAWPVDGPMELLRLTKPDRLGSKYESGLSVFIDSPPGL